MTPEPTPYTVVDVLLPLGLQSAFSYLVPQDSLRRPEPGRRVLVQFGKRKFYTGIIRAVWQTADKERVRNFKFINEVLDDVAVVTQAQLDLFDWMAQYYCCTVGDVLKAALPTGLKLESETVALALPETRLDPDALTDREYLLLEALTGAGRLSIKEIEQQLDLADPQPLLQRMAEKGLLLLQERMPQVYRARTVRCLQPAPALLRDDNELRLAFDRLKRSMRQTDLLQVVLEAHYQGRTLTQAQALELADADSAAVRALRAKGYIEYKEIPPDRLADVPQHAQQPLVLTQDQDRAVSQILAAWDEEVNRPVLLHGITGSGKTLVYIEIMRKALAEGKQVLYLLPEIGLTKQIIDRMRGAFGDAVGVYHSRFTTAERVESWKRTLLGEIQVLVGVRSAVLLPLPRLGLIVVDEEHDGSFKQHEPAPRYNARDVAVWLGRTHNVPVLLGSATPAVETYANAQNGKYALVELTQRAVATATLPALELVDMRTQERNRLSYGLYSDVVLDALRDTLARGEQAIVFRNRRGYAPVLVCDACGHVPRCEYCDISLTYHKHSDSLRCHYCGYTQGNTKSCTECGHHVLRPEGIGTERLEEHLTELLPEARIGRMDQDTTRGKQAFAELIQKLEKHELDILVGTQMVTKGLDFERVTLVVVVQVDAQLNLPDFRAHESTYQLLTQLAGRAGRSSRPGRVIIQTRKPDHPVVQLIQQPYKDFYNFELPLRSQVGYPPYSRLIRLEFQHIELQFLEDECRRMGRLLREVYRDNLLGPAFPAIARLKNAYRMQALIKILPKQNPAKVKDALREAFKRYLAEAPKKTLRIIVDVDPRQ